MLNNLNDKYFIKLIEILLINFIEKLNNTYNLFSFVENWCKKYAINTKI